MTLLSLDFETYYDNLYSLRAMTPAEYILSPKFETHLCAAAIDKKPSFIVEGPDFQKFINTFDPTTTDTITFNAPFDNAILAWRYGFLPRRMYCSMALARILRGHLLRSVSLASVAQLLGLRNKGTALIKTLGLHLAQIKADPTIWTEFCEYALLDNDLNREIFTRLIPELPVIERRTMDQVLRCTIEPQLRADSAMLVEHLGDAINPQPGSVRYEKKELVRIAGISPEQCSSAPKFEAFLASLGVEVEYKTSPAGNQVPCFAKTDAFMEELQNDHDERVRAAAMARLSIRSTIEETRGERMIQISRLPWPVTVRGNMPVPLRLSGAHTHRLSGDWRMNMQNLPAGRGGSTSKLRASLRAPAGERVVVGDLSQIECRLTAWFCDETHLLDLFRTKQDPYCALASYIFGYPCTKANEVERFIGKSGELGLGFGCGEDKFYGMVLRQARTLGLMDKVANIWTPALASKAVSTYRTTHPKIKAMWKLLGDILRSAWLGGGNPRVIFPVEIREGEVIGPGGLTMKYIPIQPAADPEYYGRSLLEVDLKYTYAGRTHKIYGAKFLENIIQFLARIVIMAAADRLYAQGLKFAMQTHDELVYCVPEKDVDAAKKLLYQELTRPPSWAPDLPMDASVGDGESYGDAK